MNALELLHLITAKNGRIRTNGKEVLCILPPDLRTSEMISLIKIHKLELCRLTARPHVEFVLTDGGGTYLSDRSQSLLQCVEDLLERFGKARVVRVVHLGTTIYEKPARRAKPKKPITSPGTPHKTA